MKMLCFIIYTLSILTTSCTHIRKYSTFDELNSKIKDKKAKIVLRDEQELIGKDVYIAPDSTFWLDPDKGNKQSINTSEVNSIILKNRIGGATDGAIIGGIIGSSIGIILGLTSPLCEPSEAFFVPCHNRLDLIFFSVEILGFPLILIGSLLGLAGGSKDKYIIDHKEEIIEERERDVDMEKEYEYNIDVKIYNPIAPNSTVKLEAPHDDILSMKQIIEQGLSSKGFDVVSKEPSDYIMRYHYNYYSINRQKRFAGFTAYVINSSTNKADVTANFIKKPKEKIVIQDVVNELIDKLFSDMK